MTVNLIIMGELLELAVPPWQSWIGLRIQALQATDNLSRPPSDFDIRTAEGAWVDPVTEVLPGTYYISPRIGAGGSHTNHRRKGYQRPLAPLAFTTCSQPGRNNPACYPDARWCFNASHRDVICANSFRLEKKFRSRGVRRTLRQTLPLEIDGEPPRQVKSDRHLRKSFWGGHR